MPVYDYECGECGVFTAFRPMSKCRDPLACPDCGQEARRAILTAPSLANMSAELRKAHATNEKAAHEPRSSHGAGCSCCSGKTRTAGEPQAAKLFPKKRPWMISH
jgi:putative FmdB family regulatory protein